MPTAKSFQFDFTQGLEFPLNLFNSLRLLTFFGYTGSNFVEIFENFSNKPTHNVYFYKFSRKNPTYIQIRFVTVLQVVVVESASRQRSPLTWFVIQAQPFQLKII
jgi:hypothetical protein